MTNIVNGNQISQLIVNRLKQKIDTIVNSIPTLALIVVGNNSDALNYVCKKKKVAKQIGIKSEIYALPGFVSENQLIRLIDVLNNDIGINGILVQLPLPHKINTLSIVNSINPIKDIDGFSAINVGKLFQGDCANFVSCTPAGILEIMRYCNIHTSGSHVVVVSRSLNVGKPMTSILLNQSDFGGNATVSVCHSKSNNLSKITRQADVLICALGRPKFIKRHMLKSNVTIIDVGINRSSDQEFKNGYRLIGDVDFTRIETFVNYITPVPGGVGPMTVAMLMYNTLKAYIKQK